MTKMMNNNDGGGGGGGDDDDDDCDGESKNKYEFTVII